MKIINSNLFMFNLILFLIILHLVFPSAVYAMADDTIQNIDQCSTGHVDYEEIIKHYGYNNTEDKDVYALCQRDKYLGIGNNSLSYVEPKNYPVSLDSASSKSNHCLNLGIKPKIVWYTGKKYTGEFKCLIEFEKSLDEPFSLRRQLNKDVKKLFNKK